MTTPFLDCAQDSGVPHQALGPPRHIKHPNKHARTEPGAGLGSEPAKVSGSPWVSFVKPFNIYSCSRR